MQDAVKDGSYQLVVDMDTFNAVVPSHDASKLCCVCVKNGGVCPVSGIALRLPRPETITVEHADSQQKIVDHRAVNVSST
jgi:hypothetical protein